MLKLTAKRSLKITLLITFESPSWDSNRIPSEGKLRALPVYFVVGGVDKKGNVYPVHAMRTCCRIGV
jgi:hypothetical protein